MTRTRRLVLALLCATLGAQAALAAHKITIAVDPLTSFSMEVPDSWRVQKHSGVGVLDVRITPKEKGDFLFLITIIPLPAGEPLPAADEVRQMILERGNDQLSGSMQQTLELTEIRAAGGVGFVYHVTDRRPEKGPRDYREAHQGEFLLGSHMATVSLLTHPGDDASVEQALAALKTLRVTP